MQQIRLTQGKYALVDDEDYGFLNRFNWYYNGCSATRFKTKIKNGKKVREQIRMHRVIMDAPDDMVVDHINGDTLDNRKENLRVCYQHENMQNIHKRRSNKYSRFKGVYFHHGSWIATIQHKKKDYHLGRFATELDAAQAYDDKARELRGFVPSTNFPLRRQSL